MNRKAQNALKSNKYPQIMFNLLSPVKVSMTNENFSGTATGELTMAGITKKINLQFSGTYSDDKKLQIKGSEKIDMTEFWNTTSYCFAWHTKNRERRYRNLHSESQTIVTYY